MKQTMNGQKVQNWHRPLDPRQLRRRFRRRRYDQVPDESEWDDYVWDDDVQPREHEGPDLCWLELRQLLREIVHPPAPLFLPEWAIDASTWSAEKATRRIEDATDLEKQLAEFVQRIKHFPNDPTTRRRIIEAIGDDVYHDVMKAAAHEPAKGRSLVENVSLFAPFWIRSPRTWDGGKTSLVDHLFVRYEVPQFLYPEWSELPGESRLKWLSWFILFAQGGSLRRAAGHFGWNIVGRFENYLRTAPAELSSPQACAFAQVLRLGGSPIDCQRILHNPAFAVDTTEAPGNGKLTKFWEATVRWIIAQSTAVTDEQCEQILAWAMHEYTETERRETPGISWKGRSLRAVLQRSLEYQQQLARPWSCYHWRKHGWDWTPDDPILDGWRFVELTSGEELFREGQAMRHCVAGYAARCAEGHSAIVSVQFREARRVTVELIPATGEVVQAKGACNRAASSDELAAIRRWLEAVVRRNRVLMATD